jgi:putative peptide zinc metalloprotease protein
VNRSARFALSGLTAAILVLSPTAASAGGETVVVAANQTAGAAVVEASVQYRVAPNGVVDEENGAYAAARCTGCQTLAAAFQIVLIPRDYDVFVPHNEAFVANLECVQCVTWASAKQVLVETGGPASLSGPGHQRLRALEGRLEALEAGMPSMSLAELQAEVNAAVEELIAVAQEEIVSHDGGRADAEVVAVRSS